MIGKFFSRIIKEITPADTTPVTLNASGTYNPRYGKHKIYVSGKAENGSTSPGSDYYTVVPGSDYYRVVPGFDYYNVVLGTPFDNSYTNLPTVVAPLNGVKVGTNTYVYGTFWVNYQTLSPTSSGQYYNGRQDLSYGNSLYNNYAATPYSAPSVPSTYIVMGFVPPSYYLSPMFSVTNDVYGNVPGSTTPGVFVQGTTGRYADTYPYAGTYAPTNEYAGTYAPTTQYAGTYAPVYYTGSSTNVFGVSIAGGISTTASVVPPTLVNANPVYGTPVQITVPPGGYVTITFKL
jgi:hypothetical protein